METTQNLIAPLLGIGLNRYEAQVYLALITEGVSTAKNVSSITGIPYGKVYEIINSLASKGFCMLLPTKPMKCRAISPRNAIEKVKEAQSRRILHIEEQILGRLEPFFEQSREFNEPKGVSWIINGRSNVAKKIEEMIGSAKGSISMLITESGLKRILIHALELQKAAERKVKIQIGCPSDAKNSEEMEALDFCAFYKRGTHPASALITIDSKESLLIEAIPDDDNIIYGRDVGLWITNPSFTKMFESTFIEMFSQKNLQNSRQEIKRGS